MAPQKVSGRFASLWAAISGPGRKRDRLKAGCRSFLSPYAPSDLDQPDPEKHPEDGTSQSPASQSIGGQDQNVPVVDAFSVEQRPATPPMHAAINEAIGSEDSRPSSPEEPDKSIIPMRILSPGKEPDIFKKCKLARIQFDTGSNGVSLVSEAILKDLKIEPYLYQSSVDVQGIGGTVRPIGQIPLLWFDPRGQPHGSTPDVYVTIFLVLSQEDGSDELPFDFLLCKADMRQINKAINRRRQAYSAFAAVRVSQLEEQLERALDEGAQ